MVKNHLFRARCCGKRVEKETGRSTGLSASGSKLSLIKPIYLFDGGESTAVTATHMQLGRRHHQPSQNVPPVQRPGLYDDQKKKTPSTKPAERNNETAAKLPRHSRVTAERVWYLGGSRPRLLCLLNQPAGVGLYKTPAKGWTELSTLIDSDEGALRSRSTFNAVAAAFRTVARLRVTVALVKGSNDRI